MAEILSFDPTISFWRSDYYNWICSTPSPNGSVECVDLFRLNLDYYFSSKDIKWNLVDYRVRKLKLLTNVTKLLNFFGKGLLLLFARFIPRLFNRKGLFDRCTSLLLHFKTKKVLLWYLGWPSRNKKCSARLWFLGRRGRRSIFT